MSTEVLVVGGGPVGLAAAIALGVHGVPYELVERHPSHSRFPKGRAVSTRTMEIFRRWGLDEEVSAASLPRDETLHFYSGSTLTAPEHRRVSSAVDGKAHPHSPTSRAICSQEVLEPILRRHAEDLVPGSVHFGVGMTRFDQDEDGVTGHLDDGRSVRARYLIAADGASSGVRERCGVLLDGPDDLCRNLNILFEADLREHVADRLSLIYTVDGGYFMAVDNDRRWLLNLVDPDERGDPADLVRAAVGVPDLRVHVVDEREWVARAQLARTFRAGRVFLAGDAAHPMTPYGGLGMNCGIQDVDNLAWKLAGVLAGWASERLLDTYDSERRPVGHATVRESRESLSAALRGSGGGRPSDGLVLGYSYESSVVIPDGTPPPAGDPVADFVPTARPGHRLPHAWLGTTSTLDLVGTGFTLLTGHRGGEWHDVVRSVPSGVPLRCREVRAVAPFGIDEGGAVLVRPDGHVASRARTTPDDPYRALYSVLRRAVAVDALSAAGTT